MQNAMYSPIASCVAGERRSLPFIMGQMMVFKREASTPSAACSAPPASSSTTCASAAASPAPVMPTCWQARAEGAGTRPRPARVLAHLPPLDGILAQLPAHVVHLAAAACSVGIVRGGDDDRRGVRLTGDRAGRACRRRRRVHRHAASLNRVYGGAPVPLRYWWTRRCCSSSRWRPRLDLDAQEGRLARPHLRRRHLGGARRRPRLIRPGRSHPHPLTCYGCARHVRRHRSLPPRSTHRRHYVTTEAVKQGFSATDPEWCNLGQGQPETGELPGAPPRVHQVAIAVDDQEYAPVAGLWGLSAPPSPICTTASTAWA